MRQPGSQATPEGRLASRQTIDSSSGVREIVTNGPPSAHRGTSAWASKRQIAYRPGSTVKVSRALGVIAANPRFCLRRSIAGKDVEQTIGILIFQHETPIHRLNKVFLNSAIKQCQKRIIITIDVQNPTRFAMYPELRPGDDLAKLFERPESAGHCDKSIRE